MPKKINTRGETKLNLIGLLKTILKPSLCPNISYCEPKYVYIFSFLLYIRTPYSPNLTYKFEKGFKIRVFRRF